MDRVEAISEGLAGAYEVFDWSVKRPRAKEPASLFGEFWSEGEVSVLFADTGFGKSTLAVQIAESVARGRAHAEAGTWSPNITANAQNVVFIDLEGTKDRFEQRYAGYSFSKRFIHAIADREKLLSGGEKAVEQLIVELTTRHKAKVLVIDSLPYLKRRLDSTIEAAEIMLTLRRVARVHGLSILVVSRSKGLVRQRSLRLGDMHTGNAIAGFADSIFAIGRFARDHRKFYIKQLKSRSAPLTLSAAYVPCFQIRTTKDGFTGFSFFAFETEEDVLETKRCTHDQDIGRIRDIKAASDRGIDIRTIAHDHCLSKSTAHRLLQIGRAMAAGTDAADTAGPQTPLPFLLRMPCPLSEAALATTDRIQQRPLRPADAAAPSPAPRQNAPRNPTAEHRRRPNVVDLPDVEEFERINNAIEDARDEHPLGSPARELLALAALRLAQAKRHARTQYAQTRHRQDPHAILKLPEFADVKWSEVWDLIDIEPDELS